MPLDGDAVTEPLLPPKQDGIVLDNVTAKAGGAVMLTVVVAVQLLASVTTTV
jgi:hypothetical protein